MEQYLEFVGNNPILFVALAVVLGLIIWTESRRFTSGFNQLSPLDAVRLMNDEEALLLDVREDAEYGQGRIDGAKHIPLSALKQRIGELESSRDRDIVAYCRSGARSAQACKTLLKNEFPKVHNLQGGLMAWESASLPVKKKKR
jgi:rhodanese-related sulfurtransferase